MLTYLTFFQKFEGDIERENAESLAADIAEFLNNRNRRKRSRAGTLPVYIDPIYFGKLCLFLIVSHTFLTCKVVVLDSLSTVCVSVSRDTFSFSQSPRSIEEHPKEETLADEEEYVMTEFSLYPVDVTVY